MTTRQLFNFDSVDPSWQSCLRDALSQMDASYLDHLYHTTQWLPNHHSIFNAFSLPLNEVHYILFGESPYPRASSANGYAFWDAAVTNLWSTTGLSKSVNRATSLRNIIKMLLVAEGLLDSDTTQAQIAQLDKSQLVQNNDELFANFIKNGFLLLNASLVLQSTPVKKDALAWHPFIRFLLQYLYDQRPQIKFLLFGNIANTIQPLIHSFSANKLYSEHPYNLSFIQNPLILDFFKPLHLLKQTP